MLLALLIAAALAYIVIGFMVMNRAMSYVRSHALLDPQYFAMAVQDGRSLSMMLPKVSLVLFWLPVLLVVALLFVLRSMRAQPSAAAAI